MKSFHTLILTLLSALMLNACGNSEKSSNDTPEISGNPASIALVGTAYNFTPNVRDSDGDSLTFSIENSPAWSSFDSATGTITGIPATPDVGTYANIVLSVTDGKATSSLAPFSITVRAENHPPTISGNPPDSVVEGQRYSFTPSASDPDGDGLTYAVSNLPEWANFDSSDGTLSGTPDYNNAGTYSGIVISASDGAASASLAAFSITVTHGNQAPTIGGQPPTTVTVGNLYDFTPTAADADDDTLTFSIANLPAWAGFSNSSGRISGTPAAEDTGVYGNIIINVTDGRDTAQLAAFSITVASDNPGDTAEIYVDPAIGPNYCADYDTSTRSCGNGDKTAYKSLNEAASVADAGDTVYLREGTYNEQLAPQNSGTADNPIVFKSYNSENARISGESLSPAIIISDKSYLIIEDLEISGVNRWLYALNAHHNTIRNNTFGGAHDSAGSSKTGLFFQEATYNKITGNVIDYSTQDNLSLIKSDYNLVEDNTITNSEHALWTIKCGNKNVLRNNYFHNASQKIGEIYDCDDVGFDHEFFIHDATKYNLVENNVFAKTSTYYSPSGGNGIQYAGQNGIIRFNVFYDNNVGFGLQYYSPEALYTKHNRIYHNTFYKNHCGGIATNDPSNADYSDNIFVNNILSKNQECGGSLPYQLVYRDGLDGFLFDTNDITSGDALPDNVIGAWQGSGNTLQWHETSYPALFANNREQDPKFTDEDQHDFTLMDTSPMIDSGRFLTTTTSSGSGDTISVEDPGYFYDGFGISGETGDEIQLEGSSDTLVIVSINYASKEITVNKSTNWTSGQGVSIKYLGKSPDIGAFESH